MAKRRYEISLRVWKGAFLRVSIATVIFSRVKISCFLVKLNVSAKPRTRQLILTERETHESERNPTFSSCNNKEGKITECWLVNEEGIFFLINFAWEEGKITRSRLVERQKFSLLIGWTYLFHIQLVSSVWAKQLRLHRSLSFNSRCIRRKGIKIKN